MTLEYIAPGIYANCAKRQVHIDVPAFLRRLGIDDNASNVRRGMTAALKELRCPELGLGGFILIARHKGIVLS